MAYMYLGVPEGAFQVYIFKSVQNLAQNFFHIKH